MRLDKIIEHGRIRYVIYCLCRSKSPHDLGGNKMDRAQLSELYKSNRAAQVFFDLMASRKRNQSESKVDRILDLLNSEEDKVSRGEIIALFRQLEELGCGEFVAGRHGWPSRFVWDVGCVSASRAAAGESEDIEEISEEADVEPQTPDFLTHTFNLRPDLEVKFGLPLDLTPNEADHLAGLIKTLPMEEYD